MIYSRFEARVAPERMEISAILPHFIGRELRGEVVVRRNSEYIGKKFGRWTVKNRIYSPNWTMKEALHTPVNGRQKLKLLRKGD